ncbi:MAG: lipocalin-like domain-containing protein [Prevotella sp.]
MRMILKTAAVAVMMLCSPCASIYAQTAGQKVVDAINSYEAKKEAAKKKISSSISDYQEKQQAGKTNIQNAVSNYKNGLGGVKSAASSWLSGLVSSKLVPSKTQIVGTWVYERPAIVFTSEDALTSLGGTAATSALEKKFQSTLDKYGISKGNMAITFNKDNTFKVTYKKRTSTGKYTVSNNVVSMTFEGQASPCKMTPQLNNGTLIIATDATKMKNFLQGLGTSSSADIATITSLLKKFNGMKLGVRLNKK